MFDNAASLIEDLLNSRRETLDLGAMAGAAEGLFSSFHSGDANDRWQQRLAQVPYLARDNYGCRVLQRLLECGNTAAAPELLELLV